MTSLRFSEVISALNPIPVIERTDAVESLLKQAEAYLRRREHASLALKEAEESGVYGAAIKKISNYLSEIAGVDIQDPQLQQMLDIAKDKMSAANRKKVLVTLVIASASVVLMVIVGLVIKINNDAKVIETAIANLDWETALELDPDNAEALRLQAAAEKAVTERVAAAEKVTKITVALAQGDWKTALALEQGNIEGLRLQDAAKDKSAADKYAAVKAGAVATALAKGDWKAVLDLEPHNSEGLRLKAAAEKAAAVKVASGKAAMGKAAMEKAAMEKAAMEKAAMEKAAMEKATILAGDPITNTFGMTLNNIPRGTFVMGSSKGGFTFWSGGQHKVTISKSFYMQTTEVTQGQWKAVMDTDPWKGTSVVREGPNYPAQCVSWEDAVAYCEKLSAKEGKTYRLPTEAEWEYACRALKATAWSFGNDENVLGTYAWFYGNTSKAGEMYGHQVRLKKPNAFGLYDMHGNVGEWCHDYYEELYYKYSPEKDPMGPASGSSRVLRGGSWNLFDARYTRSAGRRGADADERHWSRGFRVVRELD